MKLLEEVLRIADEVVREGEMIGDIRVYASATTAARKTARRWNN